MKHIQFHIIWFWIYIGLRKDYEPYRYHSIEFAIWRRRNLNPDEWERITQYREGNPHD